MEKCKACGHTLPLHGTDRGACRATGCRCQGLNLGPRFRRGAAEAAKTARAAHKDELMLADVEVHEPNFSVAEVAKVFFARSPHWVRWLERDGKMTYFDTNVGRRTDAGARVYNLADVERMAHALSHHKAIDQHQLTGALQAVRAMASIYGYLAPPEIGSGE